MTPTKKTEIDLIQLQKDVAKVTTDVALLKQAHEKVVEPSLKEIKETLNSLSFVTLKQFEDFQDEVDERFKESRKRTWVQNTVSAIFGAILTIIVTYIIRDVFNR